jgi:NAD-dependent dihydropyrimidine dehydrogenase PreA subunit
MENRDEDEYMECVADCRIVVRRETRDGHDGKPVVEDVELCTRCGQVFGRVAVSESRLR